MMKARWSARQIALQLGCSDYAVRRCWEQWIRVMSFTRRPGSGRPRHAHVQLTASLLTIQAQVAPSLGAPVFSQTERSHQTEGLLELRHPLRMLLMTPIHRRLLLEWYHTRRDCTAAEWNQVVFSDEYKFNLSSDDNRVRVWRPRDKRLNLAFALQ
ncbi:transposable element Tcb2 transposase [Trichonephila clavipes]|nr:transposable element Tcb2 transposase [Trichonephila clavipes]